jgi:hypothetical protein
MPTPVDLVTDLPADFEVFGQAVDTSLADLKGGTTGQVLKKNSNTDMDFVWGADAAGMTNPMTTTGDTIYSSSGSTPARLGIGSTGQVMTVSGGVPSWATPSGSTLNTSLITSGTITSGTKLTLSSLTSYDQLFFAFTGLNYASGGSQLDMRINGSSSPVYTMPNIENRLPSVPAGTGGMAASNSSFLFGSNYGWESANDQNGLLITMTNCKSSSGFTNVAVNGTWQHTTSTDRIIFTGQGIFGSNATVSSIEFYWEDGQSFTGGTYRLYGA